MIGNHFHFAKWPLTQNKSKPAAKRTLDEGILPRQMMTIRRDRLQSFGNDFIVDQKTSLQQTGPPTK